MESYIGKRCWQTSGYTNIKFGNVLNQRMENDWLLVEVQWDGRPITTWERVVNVSFDDICSWKLIS